MIEPPFSPETLGERWHCTPRHVQKLCRSGALPCFHVGKLLRISAAAVEAYEAGECQSQNADSSDIAGPGASLGLSEAELAAVRSAQRTGQRQKRLTKAFSQPAGDNPDRAA